MHTPMRSVKNIALCQQNYLQIQALLSMAMDAAYGSSCLYSV